MKPDLVSSYAGRLLRVRGQLQPHAPPRLSPDSSLCPIVLSGLDELNELESVARKILRLY
jgi:hypothetical protein